MALKLLFVCSRNKRRSLTAEIMLRDIAGVDAKSAGTQPGARVPLSAALIGWADIIFWMERCHFERARLKFSAQLRDKETEILDIPDNFEFMQTELQEELRAALEGWFDWPDEKPMES